jgi:hypothetical protein
MPILCFTLVTLIVVSVLFRDDLGLKSLLAYWGIWVGGLVATLALGLSPGFFVAVQAALGVAMLIQLRINPQI